jgi:cytochrome bd-type quinol oxidase subunit 1
MFLTQHEVKTIGTTFSAMGSALRISSLAALEVTAYTVDTTVNIYRTVKPYAKQAYIIALTLAAFTVAAGMVTRDYYNQYQPIIAAKLDAWIKSHESQVIATVENTPVVEVHNESSENALEATETISQVESTTVEVEPVLEVIVETVPVQSKPDYDSMKLVELRKICQEQKMPKAARSNKAQCLEWLHNR